MFSEYLELAPIAKSVKRDVVSYPFIWKLLFKFLYDRVLLPTDCLVHVLDHVAGRGR